LYNYNGSKKSGDTEKGAPCGSTPAPSGSNWSSRGGDETIEASDVEGHLLDSASMGAAACGPLRPGQKGDVKADPELKRDGKNTARKQQNAEDVTAERANESKTRLANGELLQKILWIPVTRLTNMSNLDFIVLDCELLHTPWKILN
jgi:hypothetical protein